MQIQSHLPEVHTTTIPVIAGVLIGDTCTAKGITTSGATPVLALCRALVAAGHDPATRMHVFRDGALALRIRSIDAGAKLTVDETNGTRFARWKPFQRSAVGPPRRFSAREAPDLPASPPGAICGGRVS